MTSIDPSYIVVAIILVLAALGGYYLYRNALQASDLDEPREGGGKKET